MCEAIMLVGNTNKINKSSQLWQSSQEHCRQDIEIIERHLSSELSPSKLLLPYTGLQFATLYKDSLISVNDSHIYSHCVVKHTPHWFNSHDDENIRYCGIHSGSIILFSPKKNCFQ